MQRFSIDNRFRNVSLNQFRETAKRLESSLRQVRPKIESELLLTTNREDYYGYGSLTVLTPEVEEALKKREKFQLDDLNEELWRRSFETGLYIRDFITEPYMVSLHHEIREPKRLFFYGQYLDEESQKVFDSFKRTSIFQKLGDGYPHKTSDFALNYALSKLRKPIPK